MALLLKHQTVEQFVARFREAYRNSEKEQTIKLGEFILAKIQATEITDSLCRQAFGKTVTQWNKLKSEMNNRVAAKNTLNSAIGE